MEHKPAPSAQETTDKLYGIVRDIKFGMFTSLRADGGLHARPMVTRMDGLSGPLWFFTRESAPKADEVSGDRHVCVTYADPARQVYASVSGVAALVNERSLMGRLWDPTLVAWFPNGVDDADLRLLRVDVRFGEYWDAPSSTMVEILAAVRTTGLGSPPEIEAGDNAKITL